MRFPVAHPILLGVVLAVTAVGCGDREPTSKEEVCRAYTELGAQVTQSNGLFDNPVFWKADALGDVAKRYDGVPSLAGDAEALRGIADADSTSGLELMNATRNIAELCGHPLGIGIGS